MTTGDLAGIAGIPQQTLISWDRTGVLKAKARPGRRSSPRAPRQYDEDGLLAALFAKNASLMGFKGETLKQMIRLMQRGERRPLERAALFTYRTMPGMMKHIFTPDSGAEDDRRWIDVLRERGALLEGPTSLWEIHEEFRRQARNLMRMDDLNISGTEPFMEKA